MEKKQFINYKTGDNTTAWSDLLALIRYAGQSQPERVDAIQKINNVIENYDMREWHYEVLRGLIAILSIEPRL